MNNVSTATMEYDASGKLTRQTDPLSHSEASKQRALLGPE
jgi:hypothetical protein